MKTMNEFKKRDENGEKSEENQISYTKQLKNENENNWDDFYNDSGECILNKLEKVKFFINLLITICLFN